MSRSMFFLYICINLKVYTGINTNITLYGTPTIG